MVKHNLLVFLRNAKKYRVTFFINVIGLSSALACTLLIVLWVMDELKVDQFHENDELLYQVMSNIPTENGFETDEHTPGELATALNNDIPEVAYATSVIPAAWFDSGQGIISSKETHIKASGQFVDENYFNVFSWKIIESDSNGSPKDKSSILISDELANKLFQGVKNSIGKTISWEHEEFSGKYVVSGVFEKPPKNSSIQFDILFNYQLFAEAYAKNLSNWGNSNPSTYVLLKEGTDYEIFNKKIKNISIDKYKATIGTEYLEYIGTLFAQRVSDSYLYNKFENGVQSGGRISYVKLFVLIAIFLLMIAAINFMNLSTAIASKRMKEIGIKKAIGAKRKSLIVQFLNESVLITFISLIAALILVIALLPEFNIITGKELSLKLMPKLILWVLVITIFTGLVSGSYPALYLSNFKTVKVLKGSFTSSKKTVFTRKGLVIFQFTASIILIIAVLVVSKQIEFIQNKNLGYSKDNVISFKKEGKLNKALEPFGQELKNIPGVINVSSFAHDLVGEHGKTGGLSWEGKDPKARIDFVNLEGGYNLIELLKIKVIEGRSFSEKFTSDQDDVNIIFNKAAIEIMNLNDPIGKTVKLWGKERRIIGVVENFHFESLYKEVQPCFIRYFPEGQNILVKIKAGIAAETIDRIEKVYGVFMNGLPLDFKFLDDSYQQLYASEKRVATLSNYFAGLAIIISCLGLFGLAAFTAERKRKEISIRKVLGQSSKQIMLLLSSQFIKLVFISILTAFPLAYILAINWLSRFAYKIPLQLGYFLGAGLIALSIALLTVGMQAIRAANKNPVDGLREE